MKPGAATSAEKVAAAAAHLGLAHGASSNLTKMLKAAQADIAGPARMRPRCLTPISSLPNWPGCRP